MLYVASFCKHNFILFKKPLCLNTKLLINRTLLKHSANHFKNYIASFKEHVKPIEYV